MSGGGKTKTSKKDSKKGSKKMSGGDKKKTSKKSKNGEKREIPPGLQAFLDLKKKIAEKLNVSNGTKIATVAGTVQKEIKEKNPNMKDAIEISKKAYELFESNIEKYRKMIPSN